MRIRIVQFLGGMSLIVLVWFCAHVINPDGMVGFDTRVVESGVSALFVIFVLASFVASALYFDARAVLGYIAALVIVLLTVQMAPGWFASFPGYRHGYVPLGVLLLFPLGNVLNLLWFLDRRFRLAAV